MIKTSTLNWLSGILGLWLILVVFLGFSSTLNRALFVLTGFLIAILNFWAASRSKTSVSNQNHDSEIKPPES